MKSYLLDTHIWIWSLVDPQRISSSIRAILKNESTELFLSPISVWEAILLGERNRIAMKPNPLAWVKTALSVTPVQEAPLNNEVAIVSRQLKLKHQDPADRFLVATALVFGLTLITADQALWKCEEVASLRCT